MINNLSPNLSIDQLARYAEKIIQEVEKAVVGKRETLQRLLAAFLCSGGHILIEDLPVPARMICSISVRRAQSTTIKRHGCLFLPEGA